MKKIRIKTNGDEVEVNYAKSIFDLEVGMFKDINRPLLMEIDFMLRPTNITTKSRGKIHLPVLAIKTFDKNKELIRTMTDIGNELKIPMMFSEKYVLEIPTTMNKEEYDKLVKITKLAYVE